MNRLTPSIENRERFAKLLAERIRYTVRELRDNGTGIEKFLDDRDPLMGRVTRGAVNTVLEAERLEEDCYAHIIENVLIPPLFPDETLSTPYIVAVHSAATRLRSLISVTVSTLAEEFDLDEAYLTNVLGTCNFRTPDGTTIPLFRLIPHGHGLAPTLVHITREAYGHIHSEQPAGFPQCAFNG
jgi:hypothetical protein